MKIQLEVDSLVNSKYPENAEAEDKRLLDRTKHLEKTLVVKRNGKHLPIVWIVDTLNQ